MTKSGHPFPIWQLRPTPPHTPPQRPPCPFRGSPCSPRVRGGTLLCALRRERVIIALSRSVVVPVPSFPVLAGVGERARELRAARLPPARQQRAVQLRTLGVRRPDAAEQLSVLLPKQNSPQKNFDTLAPVRPFGRVTQIQPIFSKRSHPLRAIQATPSDLKARLPTFPDRVTPPWAARCRRNSRVGAVYGRSNDLHAQQVGRRAQTAGWRAAAQHITLRVQEMCLADHPPGHRGLCMRAHWLRCQRGCSDKLSRMISGQQVGLPTALEFLRLRCACTLTAALVLTWRGVRAHAGAR